MVMICETTAIASIGSVCSIVRKKMKEDGYVNIL